MLVRAVLCIHLVAPIHRTSLCWTFLCCVDGVRGCHRGIAQGAGVDSTKLQAKSKPSGSEALLEFQGVLNVVISGISFESTHGVENGVSDTSAAVRFSRGTNAIASDLKVSGFGVGVSVTHGSHVDLDDGSIMVFNAFHSGFLVTRGSSVDVVATSELQVKVFCNSGGVNAGFRVSHNSSLQLRYLAGVVAKHAVGAEACYWGIHATYSSSVYVHAVLVNGVHKGIGLVAEKSSLVEGPAADVRNHALGVYAGQTSSVLAKPSPEMGDQAASFSVTAECVRLDDASVADVNKAACVGSTRIASLNGNSYAYTRYVDCGGEGPSDAASIGWEGSFIQHDDWRNCGEHAVKGGQEIGICCA